MDYDKNDLEIINLLKMYPMNPYMNVKLIMLLIK